MWEKHTHFIKKFDEMTEENLDRMLSNFSNLEIEDKVDIILYSISVNTKYSTYNTLKHYGLINKDIRYHIEIIKKGNIFGMEKINGGFSIISFKKILEETLSKTLYEKIEICKSYLIYLKLDLDFRNEEIFTANPVINKITTAIADCVVRNNSFDCDEQILNKIKSIEREEKMDNFLKLF